MPYLRGPGYSNHDVAIFKNFQVGKNEDRKVQLRFSANNFLNHPLWTFVNGSNNTKLAFTSAGTVNSPAFGTTTEKQGRRIVRAG